MPRQQTMKQQSQDTAAQVSDAVQQNAGSASATASNVGQQAREKAQDLQSGAANATGNLQEAATSAKNTAQSYLKEGQRFISEKAANVQEAAKKAMGTNQDYAEDARNKVDPYVDSAKEKFESAKAAAGNAREKVAEKAQPYVDSVQSFDVTKTAPFHVLTHVTSVLLYIIWRVLQLVPPAAHLVKIGEEKEKSIGVFATVASITEKVPVVGPRTVEVVSAASKSVRTDLDEQIAQHQANSKKQK